MRKQLMKQIFSMFLAVLMVFGSVPMDTYANTVSGNNIVEKTVSGNNAPVQMSLEDDLLDAQQVDGVPFTVTIDGEEITAIVESTIDWPGWDGISTSKISCYTVTVPQNANNASLEFETDMQCTYYSLSGKFIDYVNDDSYMTPATTHEVAVQDSNNDDELDGISVQNPETYSTDFYILFVYGTASCLTVKNDAPVTATAKAGGLYQLAMSNVFQETGGHSVDYTYTYNSTADPMFTKMQDGVLYLTPTTQSPGDQPYDLVLTATCADGSITHTVKLTVDPPNEGIAAQYGYDETDKSSVKVYVTISNDGMPLLGNDYNETPLANLEVEVPYFELSLYGLEQYNRYGTENGRGPYTNNTVIKRPTVLHLYIYLLERYYMGLPEEACCIGTSGVLEYAETQDILYMDSSLAFSSKNNKALLYSGGATSIFMNQFWGHDCNLMYYRNHCYPYMSPGWGSTSDYILLSDGDAIDLAMFTDWGFYHGGYFASFDQDCYNVKEAGSELTVKTRQWGTSAAAENFVDVNGSEGLSVTLYNSDWEELGTFDYDDEDSNEITIDVPEEDGIYYLMALEPSVMDPKDAKIAPAVARVVVGDAGTSGGTADITEYYKDYDFISIKDEQGRYLVDITADVIGTDYDGEIPTYQVIVEDGTEYVYVTFESGNSFAEWTAIYDVVARTSDYGSGKVIVENNEDGTVTVEIPIANYTDAETGVILEDDQYAWKYGFDFVTGTITVPTVGTAVSRILLNSYEEHLWIGDSVTLVPTVLPAEATGWTIEWTSSDENIATVDQNGKVTGVGNGTAVITATIGNVKANCTVTSEQYNTAPIVVSGTPTWNRIKAGKNTSIDVSGWFTDEQKDDLTYTVEIKKATAANFSQSYDYTAVSGPQASVDGHNISVMVPDSGIYMLYVTANDGKLTTTHQYQLTVVSNDSGVFKLNDGVTVSVYNVVAVGYHRDGNNHTVVLSKDTLTRQGAATIIKWGVTKEDGYTYSGSTSFGIAGQLTVTVTDQNGQSSQHTFKCVWECSGEHTWSDATCTTPKTCSKCYVTDGEPVHVYNMEVVKEEYLKSEATCTEAEVYYKSCVCGLVDKSETSETFVYGDKTGHAMNYHAKESASCTEKGTVAYYECSVCNKKFTDKNGKTEATNITISSMGHSYDSGKVTKKATASSKGIKTYTCKNGCGQTKTETIYAASSMKLSTSTYVYNGSAKKPSITVKTSEGKTLKNGTDYTVSYASGRKNVGRYKVTVTFKGASYTGSKAVYFTIVPKKVSSLQATLAGHDDVKLTWKKSTGATGYLVYYKKASASKWTDPITVTGKTSYTKKNLADGVKYNFKVVPYYKTSSGATKYFDENQYMTDSIYTLKKISTPKLSTSGSKVKVKWTNISGETGYQISQSTSKSETNVVATYKTTSGESKKVTATKGKKYYYKVRAYKVVDGEKVYGPWSDVKSYKR